jgi:hypothetical protein
MRRVIVHIDRLVLTGFRREDRDDVGAGLQQELERAIAERQGASLLGGMGHVARLQVNGVHIDHGSTPQHVGETVAQHIGGELKK